MSEINAKDFVHRTTMSQLDVIILLEALDEYSVSSNQQSKYAKLIKKFNIMAVKADSGFVNPVYIKKGRESSKPTVTDLGLDDEFAKFEKENASFMAEMERESAKRGNPTVDRRTEDVIPDQFKRRDDPVDSEAADAKDFFSDINNF